MPNSSYCPSHAYAPIGMFTRAEWVVKPEGVGGQSIPASPMSKMFLFQWAGATSAANDLPIHLGRWQEPS